MNAPELAAALRACREAAGLTQQRLADVLGLSREAITHYEAGRRKVPFSVAERWAEACGHRFVVQVVPDVAEKDDTTGLVDRVRALRAAGEVESVELLLDLARALPGHPAAREVVRAGVAVLGRSGLTAGAPA